MSEIERRSRMAVLIPIVGALAPAAAMLYANQPWAHASTLSDIATLVGFLLYGALPYAIAAFILVAGRSIRWLWWSVLVYAVAISIFGAAFDYALITSENSTAAIGFVFVPLYQLAGLPVALAIGAIVAFLGRRRSGMITAGGQPDRPARPRP